MREEGGREVIVKSGGWLLLNGQPPYSNLVMNELVQTAIDSIRAYYKNLNGVVAPEIEMDSDFRAFLSKGDFYHDGDDDMRAYYFYYELFQPLMKALTLIWNNVGIEVDSLALPVDFRISSSEAAEILATKFPIKRELIIASISCPLSDFDHLKPGILDANAAELSQVKTDLSGHFKRLKLAELLCDGLSGRTNDDVLTALYRVKKHRTVQDIKEGPFEEMRNTAKKLVVEFWSQKVQYSTSEIEIIEGIIKSDIFNGFREDCAVEYNRRYGHRPDRPRKTANVPTTDEGCDVILGERGLMKHLHCGSDKAQNIVHSKVLQKAGVAYRVGRTYQFDRKKLDAFLAANPEALSNLPKKK